MEKLKLNVPSSAEIVDNEDPFSDLSKLCLRQDFAETSGVKKLLTTIPVRKPNPQDFVRVHPDVEYRGNLPAIDLKEERELYVIAPGMQEELQTETIPVTLFTSINRQGVVFLWPVRLPGPDGKQNEWWRSAGEAAALAMSQWVRVKADTSLGAYQIYAAAGVLQDPIWPELPFNELLRIAFRDRIISTYDHAVLRRLRGL